MDQISKAVEILKNSGIVAFPTETVYGLGANATDDEACLKIFKLKNRPAINPLIVHVPSIDSAMRLAEFNPDAKKITKLWPGPISLILPQINNNKISKYVTAALDTIAIRIPSDPTALKLLNSLGKPIAAPSANISGKLSSTKFEHVKFNFGDKIEILKSASNLCYGLESTILDLTSEDPVILRHGYYSKELIEGILNKEVFFANEISEIKAPGMLLKHYSPNNKVRLNAISLNKNEVGISFGKNELDCIFKLNLSPKGDLIEAAANLYDYLYKADEYCSKNGLASIAIAPVPTESLGLAINDRLYRASM